MIMSKMKKGRRLLTGRFTLKSHPQTADTVASCFMRTRKFAPMRTNGFIIIALSLTAGAWAGTSGYLPGVGPVALRFERELSYRVTLPKPCRTGVAQPATSPGKFHGGTAGGDTHQSTNACSCRIRPLPRRAGDRTGGGHQRPEPTADQSDDRNKRRGHPQMFLRFFTAQRRKAAEAVIAVPPNFTPASAPPPDRRAPRLLIIPTHDLSKSILRPIGCASLLCSGSTPPAMKPIRPPAPKTAAPAALPPSHDGPQTVVVPSPRKLIQRFAILPTNSPAPTSSSKR